MPIRPLNADDIFISYTRRDASTYANGLADELGKRKFACYLDALGTEPGADLPDSLKQRIRNSQMLVVICTRRAGQRETIRKEIDEFLKTGRKQNIIPIDINHSFYGASWLKLVEGINPAVETNPLALKDGNPSPQVVERIDKQFTFRRGDERRQRLQRNAIRSLILLGGLIVLAIAAAAYLFRLASDQKQKAELATLEAQQALAQAQTARDEAKSAKEAADIAKAEAETAKNEAETQKAEAKRQKDIADIAAKDAQEKTRLADAAALRAKNAETRAQHEQAVAEVRSEANRAEVALRQRPADVPASLKLAVGAMRKSSSIGLHAVEADTALRDGLALLPRFYYHLPYFYAAAAALSPDGQFFAAVNTKTGEPDEKLRIYPLGKETPLYERDCDCSAIALSSGAAYAAAITKGNGVEIFDLHDDAKSHPVSLPEGVYPELIALSPGGRYLALTANFGESDGRHSALFVLKAADGTIVESFDNFVDTPGDRDDASGVGDAAAGREKAAPPAACDPLSMVIHAVAFGPTGNLAIGGGISPVQGNFAGRVVFWPLGIDTPNMEAEGELNHASFTNREDVRQKAEVIAVFPGSDGRSFATDKGVWKRMSGRMDYESVASLPASPYDNSDDVNGQLEFIRHLAFSPDGKNLAVVKMILNDSSLTNVALEVWAAKGHWDVASAYHEKEVAHVGFKPGGEFIITSGEAGLHTFKTDSGAEAAGTPVEPDSIGERNVFTSPYTGDLVVVDDKTVTVRNVWEKKSRIVRFGPELRAVGAAGLSPGSKFLALAGPAGAGEEQTVVVYRLDGDTYSKWKGLPPKAVLSETRNDEPQDVSVSADGWFVAVHYLERPLSFASKNYIRVFNVGAGRDVTPTAVKDFYNPSLMALSPGGQYLAVTQHNESYLLNLSAGRKDQLLGDTVIYSLAFSPNGRYLGLGSDEGVLHVFEAGRSNDEIARLQHTGKVTAVAFSDDDRYVATTSSDHHTFGINEEESYPLRVWLLQPSKLLAEATERLDSLDRTRRRDKQR